MSGRAASADPDAFDHRLARTVITSRGIRLPYQRRMAILRQRYGRHLALRLSQKEPQARGKAREAEGRALARSGGCVVLNPAFMLRCTFAPKRARASRPGRDDDRMNCHVHQAGSAPPHRLSSAVME
jgi:hypothetical protein